MTLDTLTPNYWASLLVIAVPIVLLTLLGVLVIRIVGRAAERRMESMPATLYAASSKWDYEHLNMNGEPMCRTCGQYGYNEWCAGCDDEADDDVLDIVARATTYPTVPITYRDLPPFVRQRRRPGESFTDWARRLGLAE